MDKISRLLIALLRSGLFKHPLHIEEFSSLSNKEWQQLYAMSARQGVIAIVYDALSMFDLLRLIPINVKLQWALSVDVIEKRYAIHLASARQLCDIWHSSGIKTVVLKGFSLSQYYPVPNHRECGDFDCYLLGGKYEDGNHIAEKNGAKIDRGWYKHSQIYFRGVMVENHQYLVTTRKGKSAKALNTLLADMLHNDLDVIDGTKMLVPSPMFNALFITYHSFSHFISEGITLRHICDWACFMSAEQKTIDWEEFYQLCEKYKFDRFVDVSNAIITRLLGVEILNESIVCESPYLDKVLHDILYEDAKVFNQGKDKWKKRAKLISNIYAYRWKHRDIGRSSSLQYLMTMILGFLFRREN